MDTNNEILDAIEILADKKIGENITKVLTGICTSVNIYKDTCTMNCNGVSGTVYFYGSPPEVNGLYRVFVPSNDMSRAFVIVPPRFTVNPNLLDNWYFGNPVNQRGQTEYTGVTYSIDRWYNRGDNFSVGDGCVQIDSLGPGRVWTQSIPSDLHQAIAGQTVTFSVLAEGDLSDWRITDTSGFAVTHKDTPFAGNLVSWTFVVSEYAQIGGLGAYCNVASKTIRIIAAKLELGDTQTLAHQDSTGKWVLNEIPDYGEQLRRCQRYYQKFDENVTLFYGNSGSSVGAGVRLFLPTAVQMRTKPVTSPFAIKVLPEGTVAGTNNITFTPTDCAVVPGGVCLYGTVSPTVGIGSYTYKAIVAQLCNAPLALSADL